MYGGGRGAPAHFLAGLEAEKIIRGAGISFIFLTQDSGLTSQHKPHRIRSLFSRPPDKKYLERQKITIHTGSGDGNITGPVF
ncbi:hypothetical protein EBAPG3_006035 [Nitrosospira lacus]|uniref:Uncharacterized protein n=1 Tax=Nitrosospira lacus TaxID=1288494 RepID=A0A1W6SNH8_9PROT|nr:hypothetical protein EBAPG3_006035 [Nitrosospira lacus]